MDHMASKLVQAGYVNAAVITHTASAQITMHTEKVGHITSILGGLGYINTAKTVEDTGDSSADTAVNSAHHDNNTKWVVIAVILSFLVLVALGTIIFFVMRRFRITRQAYCVVGVRKSSAMMEKDVFNAEIHEQEEEGLHTTSIPDLRERNFESGYDNVETQYDGSDYDLSTRSGDKRAKYEG